MAWSDDYLLDRQREAADRMADREPEKSIECACCGENIYNHEYAWEMPDGWWCESCISEAKHSTDCID